MELLRRVNHYQPDENDPRSNANEHERNLVFVCVIQWIVLLPTAYCLLPPDLAAYEGVIFNPKAPGFVDPLLSVIDPNPGTR